MQNYERRVEKTTKMQKLSKLCSEASLNLVEVCLPSPNGAKNLHGENAHYLDTKKNMRKKDGSVAMHGCVEFQVPSWFEDPTTSWIRIMNGLEKYVSEAMSIQEEERASGKPVAKAKPILKPSSTSNWNFIPMEQRKWTDIEVKRSKDP